MNVLSYNNYNPIVNPLNNNYSPSVTPTRACDLSYFVPYAGQAQYEEVPPKWTVEPDSTEKRDKYKNFPTPVTSEGSDETPGGCGYSEPSPIFGESKFARPGSSEYDESEVYDEAKYTHSTNSNMDFAESPELAEVRSRGNEPRIYDEKYAARINNNNNLEYDKRIYVSERYDLNSSDENYYPQNYPYSNGNVPGVGPQPKVELYDMDREMEPYTSLSGNVQLYDSCLAVKNGVFPGPLVDPLTGLPLPRRRNTANKKERKRTLTLNKAFSLLRACVPNVPTDTKLSKIKTLKLAKAYIFFLSNILESPDPMKDWVEGFKADLALYSPRKTQSQSNKDITLKASSEHMDANFTAEVRKPKGRTGWPQDVWAFELKPQQYSSSPPVRV